MNPAVSLAKLLTGHIGLINFFVYCIAQTLGAFTATVMVYLVYLYELKKYEFGIYSIQTASIFATFPKTNENDPVAIFSNFFDQFFSTSLFIIGVLSITDIKNTHASHIVKGIVIGLLLIIIGTAFGFNSGFAVNPARDFGPRLFLVIAGWGGQVFTAGNYFFWIPLVAPMAGSIFGTLLYSLFISNHWPEEVF